MENAHGARTCIADGEIHPAVTIPIACRYAVGIQTDREIQFAAECAVTLIQQNRCRVRRMADESLAGCSCDEFSVRTASQTGGIRARMRAWLPAVPVAP